MSACNKNGAPSLGSPILHWPSSAARHSTIAGAIRVFLGFFFYTSRAPQPSAAAAAAFYSSAPTPGRAAPLPSSPFSPLSRPLFSRSPPSASLGPLAALGACSPSLGCQTLRFHIIVPQETRPLHSSPLPCLSSSCLLPTTQRG